MRESLFWLGVVLLAWAPGFSILFYANGGDEKKLLDLVSTLTSSPRLVARWWGKSLTFVLGMGSRWALSAMGLLLLLVMKLADV